MLYPKEPYIPWEIKEDDYPAKGLFAEQIKFILGYGILAPSTFNSQPWKCAIRQNTVEVYLDHSRLSELSDKTGRFAYVSIGCFLQNINTAAAYFGLKLSFQFPMRKERGKTFVCKMTFTKTKRTGFEKELFHAIPNRATNRSLRANRRVPDSILERIQSFAEQGQKIAILDKSHTDDLIALSLRADNEILSNYAFRKEQSRWVRNNLTKKFDGMPAFGLGIKLIPSFFAKKIVLSPFFPKLQAKRNSRSLAQCACYVVLCAKGEKVTWIKLGMLYEKISLYATSKMMSVAPMGQFVESTIAQQALAKRIHVKSDTLPQLFLRIGYSLRPVHHSPRIPVEEILLK